MKVLATGFGNFGNIVENPSEVLVEIMNQKHDEVDTFVFKGYKSIDDNLEAILTKHKPDLILMFGLARKTPFVRLEQIAHRPVKVIGEEQYISTLPLHKLRQDLLNSEVEVKFSESAGTYWCNYLFYKVCQIMHKNKAVKYGFIHIPGATEYEKKYNKRLDLDALGSIIMDSVKASL